MRSPPRSDSKPRELTDRQAEILQFLRDSIQDRGYAPTIREIARQMQIKSPHGVQCHLKAVEEKGYLHRERNLSRAIRLIKVPGHLFWRPRLKELQEGQPFETGPRIPWRDFGFLFDPGHFLLRVSGKRWLAQQIVDGDFLVMRKGTAEAGQHVVATLSPKEAAVCQVIPADGGLQLSVGDSRFIPLRDAEILGIVEGIIRRF